MTEYEKWVLERVRSGEWEPGEDVDEDATVRRLLLRFAPGGDR